MKKVLIGLLVIVIFFIGVTIFDKATNFKSYAYINDVYTENNNIIISIDGGNGDSKYHHYELNEIGNGIYELQLYASIISGKFFPVEIEFNNESNHIKEIRQKPNNGDETGREYEVIYPSE
ncbi:hypothetical protein [Candidatus Stoquefichus massiliensis]|uniref:hypothetical protein n=1 Tax=Candidatus Stoquefichus massiliensis TaxID=1470350 RepID=UPI000480E881|nr:hypothetical protein [Candidatus Stoquefichus massiliensis]